MRRWLYGFMSVVTLTPVFAADDSLSGLLGDIFPLITDLWNTSWIGETENFYRFLYWLIIFSLLQAGTQKVVSLSNNSENKSLGRAGTVIAVSLSLIASFMTPYPMIEYLFQTYVVIIVMFLFGGAGFLFYWLGWKANGPVAGWMGSNPRLASFVRMILLFVFWTLLGLLIRILGES